MQVINYKGYEQNALVSSDIFLCTITLLKFFSQNLQYCIKRSHLCSISKEKYFTHFCIFDKVVFAFSHNINGKICRESQKVNNLKIEFLLFKDDI